MKKETRIKNLLEAGKDYYERGKYESATKKFLDALELDGENAETLYYLGIVYARLGKYEEAVDYLQKVRESELAALFKVHTEMILGYIYTIQERYEEALSVFRRIIEGGIESAQAYSVIGYIYDRLGNFKEAVLNLYRAIEIDPKNANAHNSLGYIYAESNMNLEEALSECRKAVSLDRDNPAYLDSLGWVYYKLGDISQAKNYLRKALKKAPDNEEIKNHMRVVMAEAGKAL
ncbi:MAG: tetratricopeptide repeat protein [Spirochaetota bacterium]